MKKLLKRLTPFAPDQSGAVSVLYELGGLIVICDAGGCTGNICGFDEPRWFTKKSAVFSAGLRDMDAILGRDDQLIAKLKSAVDQTDVAFTAMVGTPVPAVIATDFMALKRMAEKQTGLPAITMEAAGTHWYDEGEEDAYTKLFQTFAAEAFPVEADTLGVIGATPLEFSTIHAAGFLTEAIRSEESHWKKILCYGMDTTLEDVRRASAAARNLVVAPAGLKAAKYLQKKFGTPYTVACPWIPEKLAGELAGLTGKKVLVVHQQILANAVRDAIEKSATEGCDVTVATWFMLKKEMARSGDFRLNGEESFAEAVARGQYDAIIADPFMKRLIPDFTGTTIPFPHFAVSGMLLD